MLPQSRPKLVVVCPNGHQQRALWWWARRANDWANNVDEAWERKWRRQQRLLQYRYVKAIRRKSLWEREYTNDNIHSLWPWHGPRWAKRLCVNKDFMPSRKSEGEGQTGSPETYMGKKYDETYGEDRGTRTEQRNQDEEYEAWKRQVDADPYAVLFGRRLQNTKPNSSFLSWFLYTPEEGQLSERDPSRQTSTGFEQQPKETVSAARPPRNEADVARANWKSTDSSHKSVSIGKALSEKDDEYQYDPISMRKVKRQHDETVPEATSSSSEEVVEIPVKKFVSEQVSPANEGLEVDPAMQVEREESRDRVSEDYQTQLMLLEEENKKMSMTESQAQSNMIGEKGMFEPKCNLQQSSYSTRTSLARNEYQDASGKTEGPTNSEALFSGTAYENSSRVQGLSQHTRNAAQVEGESRAANVAVKPAGTDRYGPSAATRIMPALDRVNAINEWTKTTSANDGRVERRKNLSKDFNRREPDNGEFLSGLSAVRHKTNDGEAQEIKQDLPDEDTSPQSFDLPVSSRVEGLAKLGNWDAFRNREQSTAQTWSAKSSQPLDSVNIEILREEQHRLERTNKRLEETVVAEEQEQVLRSKAVQIAMRMKQLYEDHYGKINTRHRQTPTEEASSQSSSSDDEKMCHTNSFIAESPVRKPVLDTPNSQTEVATSNTVNANEDQNAPEEIQVKHRPQKITEIALAITRAELFITKVDLIIQKSHLRSSPTSTTQGEHSTEQTAPSLYKILAFDPVTSKVNIAETSLTTLQSKGRPLNATKILSKLHNPAKFLPHLQRLSKEGYEVVSGGSDMLIFQRVRSPTTGSELAQIADGLEDVVNDDLAEALDELPKVDSTASPVPNGPRVKRQEVVFSGGRHKAKDGRNDNKSAFGETINRVLLGGALTAGFCYFVGIVTEMIRGDIEPPKTTRRAGIYSTMDSR